MRTLSMPATAEADEGGAGLRVFDSFVGDKRLVTAVVQMPEQDKALARLAKRTRDTASVHQRSFGERAAALLVQIFDRDTACSRVADVLAQARPGALVIFYGRCEAECHILIEALGVRYPHDETAEVH